MKKTKVLVTSIVLVTSLSTGTVFAVSDAGKQLQKWYNSRFKTVTKSITNNKVNPKIDNMFDKIDSLKESLIADAKDKLESQAGSTSGFSSISIMQHANKYVDQLDKKNKELIGTKKKDGTIKKDFDIFVQQQNQDFDSSVDEQVNEFFKDLNQSLDPLVQSSKENIEAASKNAQQELSNAILSSKGQLASDLDSNKDRAFTAIKENIDSNISKSKNGISQDTQKSVNSQVQSLQNKGGELENQTKQELSNVIQNIK